MKTVMSEEVAAVDHAVKTIEV